MKKVLLTTTALVMTAGVASAEITFSGKGEAGVYRTAPTAAVAAVAARLTTTANNTSVTAANAKTNATTATSDVVQYVDGVLTTTTSTRTAGINAIAADSTTTTAIATNSLAEAKNLASRAAVAVTTAQNNLDNAATNSTATQIDQLEDALAAAKADQARLDAVLAGMTGSAAVAKGKASDMIAYSGYDMNVAVSGASENGMTFSMGFDMGAGLIADQDDDRAMDAQGTEIATSAMTIGYAGYTIRVGDDKLDDLYDDTQNGDVGISGSFGDLTFSLVTDMDDDVKAVAAQKKFTAASGNIGTATYKNAKFEDIAAVAAVYNPTSYSVGYSMGNVAFSMAGTEHDDRGQAAAKMSLTYTVSPSLSATLSSDNVGNYKDIGKVSITSKISDALSITASVKDDKDHALNTNTGGKQSQDVSISYSAGALSSTLATDEGSNWWVNAKYDLGGGATAFTTFDHTEFMVAGVSFNF